jgi:hypothetical protein
MSNNLPAKLKAHALALVNVKMEPVNIYIVESELSLCCRMIGGNITGKDWRGKILWLQKSTGEITETPWFTREEEGIWS